jgi:large subunit ribosomal protein L28
MAKECIVIGKKVHFGNTVSHANNKHRRRWEPNLQWKRIWIPSQNRYVRVRISAHGLRTLMKIGERALLGPGK